MKTKFNSLILISCVILACFYNSYHIQAQEFYEKNTSPSNFVVTENSDLGIKIAYPQNWTIQYTKGTNRPYTFELYGEEAQALEKNKNYFNRLNDTEKYQIYKFNRLNDTEKYQIYLDSSFCDFILDCRLVKDPHLQSYLLDRLEYSYQIGNPFLSIFDYLPSLVFLSPPSNSTDTFLDNIKITSFKLPDNSSLANFLDDYIDYYNQSIPSIEIEHSCQSNLLGYPGCQINYLFTEGSNIEKKQHETQQLFIEKNDKVYVLSYDSLAESTLKHFDLFKAMLNSFEIY